MGFACLLKKNDVRDFLLSFLLQCSKLPLGRKRIISIRFIFYFFGVIIFELKIGILEAMPRFAECGKGLENLAKISMKLESYFCCCYLFCYRLL